MSDEYTTIRIYDDDWARINAHKRPGDDFADAVSRILNQKEELKQELSELKDLLEGETSSKSAQNSAVTGDQPDRPARGHPNDKIDSDASEDAPFQTSVATAGEIENKVEAAIRGFNPSTSRDEEEWMPALRAAHNYLEDEGSARKQDFIDNIYPEENAGYENERTWWRKIIKPGLEQIPGIEKPQGGGSWNYAPDSD